MKRQLLLLVVLVLTSVPSVLAATSGDEEVLATIQVFLDGMAKRDAAMIKAPMLPTVNFTLMRNGKPTKTELEDLATSMSKPKPTTFLEKVHDPVVKIDNDVAIAFVPFNTYIDGKLHHCGTNVYILLKSDGKWAISSVSDTLRYEGCKE